MAMTGLMQSVLVERRNAAPVGSGKGAQAAQKLMCQLAAVKVSVTAMADAFAYRYPSEGSKVKPLAGLTPTPLVGIWNAHSSGSGRGAGGAQMPARQLAAADLCGCHGKCTSNQQIDLVRLKSYCPWQA